MAYAISRPHGRWELRESTATSRGPRSRTLASFRTLSNEVIERARQRSTRPLSADAVREAAIKAGAPVESPPVDRAAVNLISELDSGRRLDPTLRRILVDALQLSPDELQAGEPLDNARAAAMWINASPAERGRALYDLLLLADAIPHDRDRGPLRFPNLKQAPG